MSRIARVAAALAAIWIFTAVASAWAGPGAKYARNWDELTPDQRSRALENYQKYKRLPEKKRRDVDRNYERWKGMKPHDKDRVRRKFERRRGPR